MGISNKLVVPFYKKHITCVYPVALLGSTDNNVFEGDLYDKQIGNWDINSDWKLAKKYNTIICTRCAYFAKDPEMFIRKCHYYLNNSGTLYVDWGLGDHWRFKNFKVGWVKNGEREYAYGKDNYLWSTVWDNSFLENGECKNFEKMILERGYSDLKNAVFEEVPFVLNFIQIKKYFNDFLYNIISFKKPYLQMYILIKGVKK